MNFSLSLHLNPTAKILGRDYGVDINRPRASLYVIWKVFHWHTSASTSGTLSSCVYMILNIWMKTEKNNQFGLKTKQKYSFQSPGPWDSACRADLHSPGMRSWGKRRAIKMAKGQRGLLWAGRRFKKNSIVQAKKGYNQKLIWRTWAIKIQTSGVLEVWSLKAMTSVQMKIQQILVTKGGSLRKLKLPASQWILP